MKTKREYIKDAWKVYCKIYNIPHDETSVYTCRGHWYGQCRRREKNGYDTTLLSEWLIAFKVIDNETANFGAKLLREYEIL